ncbi:hypothetical protein [Tuwongella immobilis]|uniref:Glycosyltransferase RgtA/B/C/D-like domain-containing protein n=1 Tax=Tuwongella immobilis TaxID=692036 RepID=A0A6C2YR14_9BACT|nr:hypothetical protein [Tuwongella immobilis]VIP03797.1 Uncharacterized protein OS=Clostridium sp. Maddingley MBC34-26 GN=A370_05537 PE=4 SV=1 [Tuwongella immobilis]VTS04961.1 Uncharacterized protein OS=Clostridium sp. Maddingley MBC34-26 GN=A370_05537 PE=4 SV=1 [Tuwongella immobilis]
MSSAETPPVASSESATAMPQQSLASPIPLRESLRIGVIVGLLSFCVLWTYQSFVTHYSFSGNFGWTLLPGLKFGIPAHEQSHGMTVVTDELGWDGQFYYHLANDPLQRSPETTACIDHPHYRGQRIFFPAMAFLLAKLLGMAIVPPILFFALHWLTISAGVGALAGWLHQQRLSLWWALPWASWWGVLHPTSHGLPDGACDALFILSILALQSQRLLAYSVAATALCLAREGYAVYAFGVWLLSTSTLVKWSNDRRYWASFLLTALPGIVVVAWAAYLQLHLNVPESTPRTPNHPVSLPWVAWYGEVMSGIRNGLSQEVTWQIFAGLLLILVTTRTIVNARSSPTISAGIPYLLLTMCLGKMVWENYSGYPKAMGSIILMGIFLLPKDRSWWLRSMLAGCVLISAQMLFHARVAYPMHYSTAVLARNLGLQQPQPDPTPNRKFDRFDGSIIWQNAQAEIGLPKSLWNAFHRESIPFLVTVENRSPFPWYPMPQHGPMAIHLAVQILDADTQEVLTLQTVPILRVIPLGESLTQVIPIPLPRGRYIVRVTGLQQGNAWFDEINPAMGRRYPLTIR